MLLSTRTRLYSVSNASASMRVFCAVSDSNTRGITCASQSYSRSTLTADGDTKTVGLAHQLPANEQDEVTKLKEMASAEEETSWLGKAFQVMSLLYSDGEWVSEVPRCVYEGGEGRAGFVGRVGEGEGEGERWRVSGQWCASFVVFCGSCVCFVCTR